MSRAYRIKVQETLRRVLRAEDGVHTQLGLLEILPREQMAQLLGEELERRGYERQGATLVRRVADTLVTVDPSDGSVAVQAAACEEVHLEGAKESRGFDDQERSEKDLQGKLRESLHHELEKQAQSQEAELQQSLTDRLETQLGDLRTELDQAVNRVTAEALKRKAAQLGRIKEMNENPESGELTIVLEV